MCDRRYRRIDLPIHDPPGYGGNTSIVPYYVRGAFLPTAAVEASEGASSGLSAYLSGEKRGDEQTTAIVSRVGYGRILVFCDQELFVAKELELASGRREKTI